MRFRGWLGVLLFLVLSFSTAMVSAASAGNEIQITGVHWSRTADAVTGLIKVRLTLETSAPVEVEHFLTASPNWRIVATLKGVNTDKLKVTPSPDVSVVTRMSVIKSVRETTHIVVDLPGAVKQEQYKVYTLPADSRAKLPFRIVFDVERVVPLAELKFSPGLRGKLVAIDPGHGGSDPGAIGVRGSREKQLNLSVATKVKEILEKAGAKVLMTRVNDVDVASPNASDRDELWSRTLVGNRNQADVFISVHHNSSVNPDRYGTSTYYYQKTNFDLLLAGSLQEEMLKAGGLANFGVRSANFFVVKNTTMPAALLEIGFMSNPREEQTLNDPVFQQKMAEGIVTGIDKFFGQVAKMRGEP